MANKPTRPVSPVSKTPSKAPAAPAKATATVSTPVRNTAIPKAQSTSAKREITFDMIAKRAYEIHCSGKGGSQDENWFRAERELRGQ
jgi:hypothetical protein